MKQCSFNCEHVLGQELCINTTESMNHISATLQGTDTHSGSPRSPSLCSSKFCSSQCTSIINKQIQMKIRKKGRISCMQRLKISQEGCLAYGRPVSVVIYCDRQVRFSIRAILLQIWNVLFMPSL